ncbi:MAG: hypothetical protein SF029_14655 [bacterium]|nr:hypothetical protein [bacterium]
MNNEPIPDSDDTRELSPLFEHDRALDKREIVERTIHALQPKGIVLRPQNDLPAASQSALQPSLQATGVKKPDEIKIEPSPTAAPPWMLQQFFNGEIDLDIELATRFQRMPLMSNISFRGLGTKNERGVATITTQDNAAQVVFEADAATRVVQMAFTYGSMLTLRFGLRSLNDVDRSRWLELMRRDQGGLAFLWGPARWEHDYLICISRKYYTNLYAFSPNNFEAAVRLTPEVTRKLLDWLEKFWRDSELNEDDQPPLLTW